MPVIFEPGGDILRCDQQTLVCPVNTVGVMGNGLALAMANRYRGLLYNYRKACRTGALVTARVWVYKYNDYQQILCFPTKQDWRNPSELRWIKHGLKDIARNWKELGIQSLAMPKIGCGEGGLEWNDVCPLIYSILYPLPFTTVVFGEDTQVPFDSLPKEKCR